MNQIFTEVTLSINVMLYDLPDNPSKQAILDKISNVMMSYDKLVNSMSNITEESIVDVKQWTIRGTIGPNDA